MESLKSYSLSKKKNIVNSWKFDQYHTNICLFSWSHWTYTENELAQKLIEYETSSFLSCVWRSIYKITILHPPPKKKVKIKKAQYLHPPMATDFIIILIYTWDKIAKFFHLICKTDFTFYSKIQSKFTRSNDNISRFCWTLNQYLYRKYNVT